MAARYPLSPLAPSITQPAAAAAALSHDSPKPDAAQPSALSSDTPDENAAPRPRAAENSDVDALHRTPRTRLGGVALFSDSGIESGSDGEQSAGRSLPPPPPCDPAQRSSFPRAAPDEQCGHDDEEASVDDAMRRFLAFANRGRASGSTLPAVLAQLNRVVEDADEADAETAKLFVSGVAGIIRQERHIQAAVAEILEDASLVVDIPAVLALASSSSSSPGIPSPHPMTPPSSQSPRSPDEQHAFEAWLARAAAFKDLGATRLDGGRCTHGLAPAVLRRARDDGGAPPTAAAERPLRRRLLDYLCERAVYAECACRGIKYPVPGPLRLRVRPDISQSSRVCVGECGSFLEGKSVPAQA
ncbi:hypothetical protein BC628DRAFT_1427778 [Trametes gibbosa]|nr:hypothetical protein BC628DRAFT_1427778 [Trametes gibbosa]